MHVLGLPLLTIVIFFPLAGALLLLGIPKAREDIAQTRCPGRLSD